MRENKRKHDGVGEDKKIKGWGVYTKFALLKRRERKKMQLKERQNENAIIGQKEREFNDRRDTL